MGTFVASKKIHHGLSTKLSFSAAMESLGHEHSTRVVIADLVQAPDHVLAALGDPSSGMVLRIKRLRFVDGEPVAIHETFLPSAYSMIFEQDLTGSLTVAMAAVGARVVTTRDTVVATVANDEHAALLNTTTGAALLEVHGPGFGDDGKPLRYTEAFYRGDRFAFELEAANPSEMTAGIAVRSSS
jgi:GntR family transcriptional regulator